MAALPFPVANANKKKPVQVFECPTEVWKQRSKPTKPGKGKEVAEEKEKDDKALSDEIRKQFLDTLHDVKEFAGANLKGKEKKQYEAKRIEALGGKASNNRKTPYHILMGIKKKREEREKRQELAAKESGLVLGKRKPAGGKRETKKRTKVDYGIQATKGRFKNGVLHVKGL